MSLAGQVWPPWSQSWVWSFAGDRLATATGWQHGTSRSSTNRAMRGGGCRSVRTMSIRLPCWSVTGAPGGGGVEGDRPGERGGDRLSAGRARRAGHPSRAASTGRPSHSPPGLPRRPGASQAQAAQGVGAPLIGVRSSRRFQVSASCRTLSFQHRRPVGPAATPTARWCRRPGG